MTYFEPKDKYGAQVKLLNYYLLI